MAAEQENNSRSKYWCFTHQATENKQGQYELKWPDRLCMFKSQRAKYNITFLVYQEERGHGDEKEENEELRGHYHIQGYMELDKDIERQTLSKIFSKRIHWEKRFGTAQQAEDYCTKEDTRVVDGLNGKFGERSTVGQGQRTDLLACQKIIDDPTIKNKKRKLAEECGAAVVKYSKGLEAYALWKGVDLEPSRENKAREVYIIWGAAGHGKTLFGKRLIGLDSYYQPQQNAARQLSFEDYAGQKWILLEDYDPGTISLGALKRMTDFGDCVLPGRGAGSSRRAMHDGVIITSNSNPANWAEVEGTLNKEHYKAIERRCAEVIQVTEMGQWIYTKAKKTLPDQMPRLEKWARGLGIWQEPIAKTRLQLVDEEDQKQPEPEPVEEQEEDEEYCAPTQPMNYFSQDQDPKPVGHHYTQIDLTQSDEE